MDCESINTSDSFERARKLERNSRVARSAFLSDTHLLKMIAHEIIENRSNSSSTPLAIGLALKSKSMSVLLCVSVV